MYLGQIFVLDSKILAKKLFITHFISLIGDSSFGWVNYDRFSAPCTLKVILENLLDLTTPPSQAFLSLLSTKVKMLTWFRTSESFIVRSSCPLIVSAHRVRSSCPLIVSAHVNMNEI